jgi:hypothetical protein
MIPKEFLALTAGRRVEGAEDAILSRWPADIPLPAHGVRRRIPQTEKI